MQTDHRKRHPHLSYLPITIGGFFARYSWVIVKNVIGWILILSSLLVGGLFPGPLGTPMFLIGFALITFPGKRRATSRVMRGIPLNLHTRVARQARLAAALLLPPLTVWFLSRRKHAILHPAQLGLLRLCLLYSLSILATWIAVALLLLGINLVIRLIPRMRRRVRPWLKRRGINLLPPRLKRTGPTSASSPPNEEILEIHLTGRMKTMHTSLSRSTRRGLRFWSKRPNP